MEVRDEKGKPVTDEKSRNKNKKKTVCSFVCSTLLLLDFMNKLCEMVINILWVIDRNYCLVSLGWVLTMFVTYSAAH